MDSNANGTYRCGIIMFVDSNNGFVAIWITYLKIEKKNELIMEFSNCFVLISWSIYFDFPQKLPTT